MFSDGVGRLAKVDSTLRSCHDQWDALRYGDLGRGQSHRRAHLAMMVDGIFGQRSGRDVRVLDRTVQLIRPRISLFMVSGSQPPTPPPPTLLTTFSTINRCTSEMPIPKHVIILTRNTAIQNITRTPRPTISKLKSPVRRGMETCTTSWFPYPSLTCSAGRLIP